MVILVVYYCIEWSGAQETSADVDIVLSRWSHVFIFVTCFKWLFVMTGNILFQVCCSFSNISPVEGSTQWKSEFSIDSAIIKVGTKVAWIDVLMVGVLRYAMSVWSVCWVDWENLQQETASIRDKLAAWGDLLVGQREECCIVDLSLSDWYALESYL